jgi:hypothetical protein
MVRNIWKPAALALGAVLATSGFAAAQDTLRIGGFGPAKSGIGGGTMTLAGKGTMAEAAASTDDVELTHGWRWRARWGWGGGWGWGGWGWRGGWGWHGGWHGGWARGWPVGWHGGWARTWPVGWGGGWAGGWGGGVRVVTSSVGFYDPWCYNGGFVVGIGGRGPAVALTLNGSATAQAAPAIQSQPQLGPSLLPAPNPLPQGNGTFPYDGGPATPVPQPGGATPAPGPTTPPAPPVPPNGELQVALKVKEKPAAKRYTYKAYGEK